MKIISKYKDYYDYLSGVYGEDPKIILDRRSYIGGATQIPGGKGVTSVHLCGKVIQGWYQDNTLFWGESLQQISSKKPDWVWGNEKKMRDDPRYVYILDDRYRYQRGYFRCMDLVEDVEKLNEKENCPIIWSFGEDLKSMTSKCVHFPILEDLGINKHLSAKDLYLMLSEWLAPKDSIVDNRTNEEKILSAGFDKKTSFRNVK